MNYYGDTAAYTTGQAAGLLGVLSGVFMFIWILGMALSIFFIVVNWKLFTKAGKPGWATLIPIYNIYIMCEIAEKEWWHILLLFVPIANIYATFVIYDGIAKKFGKDTGFTFGMIFLPLIFFPILAFGNAEYEGSNGEVNNYNENTAQNDSNNLCVTNNVRENKEDTINNSISNSDIKNDTAIEEVIKDSSGVYDAPIFNDFSSANSQNNVASINTINEQSSFNATPTNTVNEQPSYNTAPTNTVNEQPNYNNNFNQNNQ